MLPVADNTHEANVAGVLARPSSSNNPISIGDDALINASDALKHAVAAFSALDSVAASDALNALANVINAVAASRASVALNIVAGSDDALSAVAVSNDGDGDGSAVGSAVGLTDGGADGGNGGTGGTGGTGGDGDDGDDGDDDNGTRLPPDAVQARVNDLTNMFQGVHLERMAEHLPVFRSTNYTNPATGNAIRGSGWLDPNTYQSRKGHVHNTQRPPPLPCFNCNGNHWRKNCPHARGAAAWT